jgi:hypothetical protein
MMTLDWITCGGDDHWCSLERVAVDNLDVIGVYLIWHEGVPSRVVKIGRGHVGERLSELKRDPEILAYRAKGVLRVTWAAVPPPQLEGVLRYLMEKWRPPVLTLYSEATPIEVNAPWKAGAGVDARLKTPLEPRAAGR